MPTPKRKNKIEQVAARRQQGIVVLEDIYDPHNAQAIFRTMDAFGWQQAELIFEQQDKFKPRQIGKSSSSSANKWLDFKTHNSTTECLQALHDEDYQIVATVLNADATSIFETDLTHPKLALMLGNEHAGLSEQAVARADKHIYIPMQGMVQSLNLSVTAAICLYEISRQRRSEGLEKYLLNSQQQSELISNFLNK